MPVTFHCIGNPLRRNRKYGSYCSGQPVSAATANTWAAKKPGSSQVVEAFSANVPHGFDLGRLKLTALVFEAFEGGLEIGRGEVAAEDQGCLAEPLVVEGRPDHFRSGG